MKSGNLFFFFFFFFNLFTPLKAKATTKEWGYLFTQHSTLNLPYLPWNIIYLTGEQVSGSASRDVTRGGFEPGTLRFRVERLNHWATFVKLIEVIEFFVQLTTILSN